MCSSATSGMTLAIVDPVASSITAAALPSTRLNFALFGHEHLLVLTLDAKTGASQRRRSISSRPMTRCPPEKAR